MEMQEWDSGKLFKVSGSYWQSCTIHAGAKLDVFTVIGNECFTSEEVARKINSDKRGMALLLNALAAMGLLLKSEDGYSNTSFSNTFLNASSSKYLGHIIKHHRNLITLWSQLDTAVQSGRPVRSKVSHGDEEERENFLMGMFNLAMGIAPGLSKIIDLSDRRHLLDLGGGPGTYAVHFCKENPALKASVFDLGTTRPFAEKTVEAFSLSDRIAFIEGDYLNDDIPGGFDVAWLSYILHGEGPDDCRQIIRKTVSALQPGGLIMIHEFILNNTMDGPLLPALFSLNMLVGTDNGQAYSEKQLAEMLENEGVKDIRRLDFTGPSESGIITGTV